MPSHGYERRRARKRETGREIGAGPGGLATAYPLAAQRDTCGFEVGKLDAGSLRNGLEEIETGCVEGGNAGVNTGETPLPATATCQGHVSKGGGGRAKSQENPWKPRAKGNALLQDTVRGTNRLRLVPSQPHSKQGNQQRTL